MGPPLGPEEVTLVDLSMPIEEHWRFAPQFSSKLLEKPRFTFHSTSLTMGAHGFSHVDAPFHVGIDLPRIDQIELSHFWGPAAVIDCSDLGDHVPLDRQVLAARGGHVQSGDIVLLRTDQGVRHPTTTREYWTRSPWVTVDGAQHLLELGVKAIGFDFPQDRGIREDYDPHWSPSTNSAEDWACHTVLLPVGILQIEYLTNLASLSQERCTVMALPIRLSGADGAPSRVVAFENRGEGA